ncbi:hypothetical protein FB45DRAFT_40228 [Roridomyces roridus]|uniref:Uncharacterized protein n=1 Tax=Roridomyces roridus TaxID=1738132 RepID=A0AAD7BRJ8_9AGAR|nr:hypothetical protein FB45DRAFT_40228 [Roridomyces roridus]
MGGDVRSATRGFFIWVGGMRLEEKGTEKVATLAEVVFLPLLKVAKASHESFARTARQPPLSQNRDFSTESIYLDRFYDVMLAKHLVKPASPVYPPNQPQTPSPPHDKNFLDLLFEQEEEENLFVDDDGVPKGPLIPHSSHISLEGQDQELAVGGDPQDGYHVPMSLDHQVQALIIDNNKPAGSWFAANHCSEEEEEGEWEEVLPDHATSVNLSADEAACGLLYANDEQSYWCYDDDEKKSTADEDEESTTDEDEESTTDEETDSDDD